MNTIKTHWNVRVILIGGPSNAGKSTLAQFLAFQLGWWHASTDKVQRARHPGRPWTDKGTIPKHVADHYLTLSVDELFARVVHHYQSMWPGIESLITSHATDPSAEPLVLEGSALWPETVVTLNLDNVAAIWLKPSNKLLEERILKASRFAEASDREKMMIQKFMGRVHQYNEHMMDMVKRFGLRAIDVDATSAVEELSDRCLRLIGYEDCNGRDS